MLLRGMVKEPQRGLLGGCDGIQLDSVHRSELGSLYGLLLPTPFIICGGFARRHQPWSELRRGDTGSS